MATTEQQGTTSSDTLQGWKDIANYLGRSTRAVQRWERELDLPVHRISTTNGQTVYALKPEIDSWRRTRDLPKPQPGDDDGNGNGTSLNGNGHPLEPADEAATIAAPLPRQGPRWATVWAIAALTLAIGLLVGQFLRDPQRGPITWLQAAGTSVTALDAQNRVVWRHEFHEDVSYAGPALQHVAVDPDDVVLPLRYAAFGQRTTRNDALVAFDSSGNIRWQVQPGETTVTCGGEDYSGPWEIGDVVVSHATSARTRWVAFKHNSWWPSFLLEVKDEGPKTSGRLVYVQSGWIRGIQEWQTPQGQFLVVGGVYNEFNRASTTFLNLASGPARSPTSNASFECTSAPKGTPDSAYLWPSLDILAEGATPLGSRIAPIQDGLSVLLEQSGGDIVAEMTNQRVISRLGFADNYWVEHRRQERAGVITHSAEACPELKRPQPIEQWTPATGWVHSTILPTVRQTVQRK